MVESGLRKLVDYHPSSQSESNQDSDCESQKKMIPLRDLCQQCNVNEHKYRCPRCNYLSCSLACIKRHKENTNCDGIRQKVPIGKSFTKISEMSVNMLRSEMRLIEEGINLSNKAKKENILAKVGAS